MKAIQFAALALIVPSFAFAEAWEFDSSHSQARFTVKHLAITDVSGTLGKVTGTADLDDKDVTKSKIELSIEIAPDTQEPKRDEHLKSPDFFDAAKFPTATFKSKKITKAGGDKLKVTGDLTMKDVTKEVTLDATISKAVENPFSKQPVRAAHATGTINRNDWNLKWNMAAANNSFVVSNDVRIEFQAELKKPAPAEAAAPKAEEKKAEMAKPAAAPAAAPVKK